MQSPATIVIPVVRSRKLTAIVAFAHLVAAASVATANVPAPLSVVLLLALGVSLQRLFVAIAPFKLVLSPEGRLTKVGADRTALGPFDVHRASARLGSLLLLLYRDRGRFHSIALLPDSLVNAADWHDLLLWMEWRAGTPSRSTVT